MLNVSVCTLTGTSSTGAHTHTAYKTHLRACVSVSHVRFLDLHMAKEMQCPKSVFFILFSTSAICYSMIMISLSFFFSSWVFMTGRLGAVIPVLYTTWHRPAVRGPDWTSIWLRCCHQHPAGSGISDTKVFKVKEITVITFVYIWVNGRVVTYKCHFLI